MKNIINEHYYQNGRYLETLKINSKGQIIIPKEVRNLFQIHVGEFLLLLADKKQGIALQKMSGFDGIFKLAFQKEEQK